MIIQIHLILHPSKFMKIPFQMIKQYLIQFHYPPNLFWRKLQSTNGILMLNMKQDLVNCPRVLEVMSRI